MSPETYGVQPGEHIPGQVLHRYLNDFAKKFGILSRTQFNTKVESLEPTQDGGWRLITTSDGKTEVLVTKRIIVATGLTCLPNFPQYAGAETFDAPCFHAKDFYRYGETIDTAENAVIVGGGKSAYDVAYAYAAQGCHVDMVIRNDGNGPVWLSYPWVIGGRKRLERLLTTRWLTWFSPCPFGA